MSFALLALYPGLILIDNGHFQYNNISLGLFLLSAASFLRRSDLIGAFLFTCALNYKQMELYHALPVFCCLLGSALRERRSMFAAMGWVAMIGFVVVATFAATWWPFLDDLESAMQVAHRIFPVARGVFEDKVANFWCSVNILVKVSDTLKSDFLTSAFLTCLSMTGERDCSGPVQDGDTLRRLHSGR